MEELKWTFLEEELYCVLQELKTSLVSEGTVFFLRRGVGAKMTRLSPFLEGNGDAIRI